MSQFHFTPEDYLDLMHSEIPAYDSLQEEMVEATEGMGSVDRILELGTGTGETSRRVLERHPQARLTGIDVSEEMLAAAKRILPLERVDELLVQGIQDPLPGGPFELVISALTVHHLDAAGKADLFRRCARCLGRGGRFVMGDVIVPEAPADAVTPVSPGYDMPDKIEELLSALREAGFEAELRWRLKDLAVIVADLP